MLLNVSDRTPNVFRSLKIEGPVYSYFDSKCEMRCGCWKSSSQIRDLRVAVALFRVFSPVPWQKKYERLGASIDGWSESSRIIPIKSIVFPVPACPFIHSRRHSERTDSLLLQSVNTTYSLVRRIYLYASSTNLSFFLSMVSMSDCGSTTKRSRKNYLFLPSVCIFFC